LHCVLAGVRTGQQAVYLIGIPSLYAFTVLGNATGIALFLAYLLVRGVVDPIRRSSDRPWWGQQPAAAAIALPLAAALDIAKWLGIVQGLGIRILRCVAFGGKRHDDS
jgi:hypothetical protein